ncbi:MAG: arginase [Alphaproteobacteria bacterium]|nr:arginase [Alphaproteobacteria bacterium]
MRIIDLDGSVTSQPLFRQKIATGEAQCLSMPDLGPALRLWGTRQAMVAFAERLAQAPSPPGCGVNITFLGSGDFHHLCPLLLTALLEPVTLLHFDNHPDWTRFAPRTHCGAWVNRALELPLVARVVTLGPCSRDLLYPYFKGANLAALRQGRLHLFPWRPPPRRGGSLPAWRCVADDWEPFLDTLLASLPTEAVWVSIDKDVLRPEDAITNWDQGRMPLSALLVALRRIRAARRLLGVDICGEFAPIRHPNLLKRLESWLDQPSLPMAPDLTRNAVTNAAILAVFE